ncbi:MAG: hypothetical protein QOF13_2582 [Solirubrobacterales bacterium]|nr:hypothetical protein [Solirubrobacterales bacterium]
MRRRAGALATLVALLACASLAGATVVQQGNLRITVLSQILPYKLPRQGTAPIAVFVSGHLSAPHGGIPAQLQEMTVEVNKHGLLQSRGLPACPLSRIQPASTERALSSCGDALIGSGQFWAHIVLPDQGAYATHGRLLIFNGRQKGKPVIFTHIFTANPFFSSFVIPFELRHVSRGAYGTRLTASLPQALGDWGYVDRIKLTLKRKYTYRGRQLSYFNAGCPAPEGSKRTVFPLALASFDFADGASLSARVEKACAVKE